MHDDNHTIRSLFTWRRGGSLIDHTQMIWGEMKPIEPCVHFPMTSQAQIKNARNQRRQPFVLEKIQ